MHSTGNLPTGLKIGLFLIVAGIASLFFFLDPEEQRLFPKCVFHSVTGYYCPGCGSQRAIYSLLHLNIPGVVSNNFLFLPGMIVVIYGVVLPAVNRKFGVNYPNFLYYKWTPLWILIIVILFAVLRNLPWYPFSLLAPGS